MAKQGKIQDLRLILLPFYPQLREILGMFQLQT